MADAAAQVAVPRKPAASTDSTVQSIPLSLVVSDHDSVAELLQKSQGRERDEYALTALRIGLLALKHARGQIDAEAARREGERLVLELQHALEQSRNEIHGNLTLALKEYFDPKSGRFQERVDRLIKQDGELEHVLRRQIGKDGSELASTLAAHIGENSPLMRLLNRDESDRLVSSIRSGIADLMGSERERILSEFSLDNAQGALRLTTTQNGALHPESGSSELSRRRVMARLARTEKMPRPPFEVGVGSSERPPLASISGVS